MTEFRIVVLAEDGHICAASQGMDFATASHASLLMRCKGYNATIAVDTRPLTHLAATPGAGFYCEPLGTSPGSCPLHVAPNAAPPKPAVPAKPLPVPQGTAPQGAGAPLVKIHVPAALHVWLHAIARVMGQALRRLLPIEAVPQLRVVAELDETDDATRPGK